MAIQAAEIGEALARAICHVANPEMVVLFGSQARGEAHEQSDVDLLVVAEKKNWRSAARRIEVARLRRSLPQIGRPIDVLLFTPSEVDQWRHAQNHVIAHALREGVVIHERS
jgi:predicted nucleotidyltransferase